MIHLSGFLIQISIQYFNTLKIRKIRIFLLPQIFVIRMSHKQGFCCKSIRLNFNISSGDLVDKTGLSNIGKSANNDGTGVGIDARQPRQMLTYLFQIFQVLLLSLHNGRHSAQRGLFQLFASEKLINLVKNSNSVL